MDQIPCIRLNVDVACIQNEKQLFAFKYGEVHIDETRCAIRLVDTHDKDLKESLSKKGININDDQFLIPLKRNKKQNWIPSYLPFDMLPNDGENLLCYHTEYIGNENNYVVLKVLGNPLECITNFTKEKNNG